MFSKQVHAYCDKIYFYLSGQKLQVTLFRMKQSIRSLTMASFLSFTLIMHKPDKCSVDIVDQAISWHIVVY